MSYIGDTHQEVRRAIRCGEVCHDDDYDCLWISGGKTKPLTVTRDADGNPIAHDIIQRWFNARSGTKVVVGWVNFRDSVDRPLGKNDIMTVVVKKPAVTWEYAQDFHEDTGRPLTPILLFEDLLEKAVVEVDGRLRYIHPGYEMHGYWSPTFNGDDGCRYGTSPFFVWIE
jgi:hypothetical protein